jgi:cytochrome c-type biogenesis protein CcmE
VARSTRSPARLIIALGVAGVLAVFLVYTALVGASTPQLKPSQLASLHPTSVSVVGRVTGPIRGDSHASGGLRFAVHDIGSKAPLVQVVYRGDSPPPLFAPTRDVVLTGTYVHGRVLATGIVTKCPSKYQPAKTPA